MSTAVTMPNLCGCGCGQAVSGRRFLNARHKQRVASTPKTYPHYVSADLREDLCRHGNVVTEWLKRWPSRPGEGTAASQWVTLLGCPECSAEEKARLEGFKRKPTSACAARTCKCPAPKCNHGEMNMGPGSLGWHSWHCANHALVEDKEAVTGIVAKPFVLIGSNCEAKLTAWREVS